MRQALNVTAIAKILEVYKDTITSLWEMTLGPLIIENGCLSSRACNLAVYDVTRA